MLKVIQFMIKSIIPKQQEHTKLKYYQKHMLNDQGQSILD